MPRTRRPGIALRLALGGRTPIGRLPDRDTHDVLAIPGSPACGLSTLGWSLDVRRRRVASPAAGEP